MSHFNRSFIRLRTHCGFKTAYNFYHSNGGRRVFPFTYAHYLKIERGGSLPQPSALAIMLALLRRTISASERKELMRDYLRDLCGDGAVYDELFAPLLASTEGNVAENALPRVLGRLTQNLTPAQFRAVVSSTEATACFLLLSSVPDALPLETIAELIESSKEACAAALKALRKHRLAVARGSDRHACAILVERKCMFPTSLGLQALHAQLRKNVDRIADKHHKSEHGSWFSVRLQASAADRAIHSFDEVFDMTASFSEKMMPPGPETPLYFIEARVRRLVAFPPAGDARAPGLDG